MAVQLQITVRDMAHSGVLEARIRTKVAALEKLHDRLTACRVTLEAPHHHHHRGNHFCVRLDIRAPGFEIVVSRDHAKDVYVALRDAFQAAKRQLTEYLERRQGADPMHRPAGQARDG